MLSSFIYLIYLLIEEGDINMFFRRRIYFVAILLLVIFATVMFAFIAKNNATQDYKGTLVKEQGQVWVI